MKYISASLDDIIADAQDTKGGIAWLKKEATKKVGGKPISFLQLKRNYFLEFHPEDVPVAKEKETFRDIIANL